MIPMITDAEKQFIEDLPSFSQFSDVADPGRYRALPDDWFLAVADIVDSTGAVSAGRYKEVNMAGAGVIAAILNTLGEPALPFVFSGDGAVVAIPPSGMAAVRNSLADVVRWVSDDFGFIMRAAIVPVSEICASGHEVRVARFMASGDVAYAMFAGGGSSWAEARMKQGLYSVEAAPSGSRPPLQGLSCRWAPLPARHGEVVSIIVMPGERGDSPEFRDLVSEIVRLASGQDRAGHPVPAAGPAAGFSVRGIVAEAIAGAATGSGRLRNGFSILFQAAIVWLSSRLGIRPGGFDASDYRRAVASNTDFRKFDDGLKMTVDIDAACADAIEKCLLVASQAGICHYGLHRQDAVLLTCIVPSPLSREHMHFVDGASGGYSRAASEMKARVAAMRAAQ